MPAKGIHNPAQLSDPNEYDDLMMMSPMSILEIQKKLGVVDNGFRDKDDMVQRIILTKRKEKKVSHNPFEKFAEGKSDTKSKSNLLIDILQMLQNALNKIPTGPLSGVLLLERLLAHDNLLEEIQARIKALEEREPLIIMAGETNGGKSTFMNLILGETILPTDVVHCTVAITKIKYSQTYSIETLDHSGNVETYPCQGTQDAYDKLKGFVAQEDQKSRLKGTQYKEITLRMPATILKSGVTLVDTPGIGEMDEMDDVTMSYIKSTRAAGFIYIIKSDTAGGVQEDRLVSFLKAIQEDFKKDNVESAIDPRSAMFICNRWDEISKEGEEIVKKNALTKLDIVWPGFRTEQMHFFSSKKAQLHFEADPEFITDGLNDVLIGMNRLFNRAAHNTIQHQYNWTKFFLQHASRHLSTMINHCIRSNEELEDLFRTVAAKQENLMKKSNDTLPNAKDALKRYKMRLKSEVSDILSSIEADHMDDYDQLVSIITDKYLQDSKNKKEADQWIVNSIIRHVDNVIHDNGILEELEQEAKSLIQEHMGLHQEEMKEITKLVRGKAEEDPTGARRKSRVSCQFYGSSSSSTDSSTASAGSSVFETFENMNPSQLNTAVQTFLGKKKKSRGLLSMLPNVKRKMMMSVDSGAETLGRSGKTYMNIPAYVERRMKKHATSMRENVDIVEGFAVGYLHLIELYMQSALKHIPHFIGVNNKLMDEIRDNRRVLKDDKEKMVTAMGEMEPYRGRLRGYGMLYMEDVNADNVIFNTDRRNSCVNIYAQHLGISTGLNDSGFIETGSSRNRVRGFWTDLRNAVIKIDGEPSDMTLKTYTIPIDTNTQLAEIAALRYLGHANLAPFFGMTRIANSSDQPDSPEKMSGFIFEGSLMSARVFKNNPLIVQKDFIKNFVHELISGLEYIHRENMVHMELNLDTVMVNFQSGVVQLCHQCKPREIQLPKDLSIATKSIVCLSPSVLQGCEYGINDDIYAFALLLWELLFPENLPYAEQRTWTLEKFIDKVCPSQMLGPEIENLEASDAVLTVFRRALLVGRRSHTLTARDIRSLLDNLGKDSALNKFQQERRRPIVKRWSRDKIMLSDTSGESQYRPKSHSVDTTPISKTERNGDAPVRPPRRTDLKRASVPTITFTPVSLHDNDTFKSGSSSDIQSDLQICEEETPTLDRSFNSIPDLKTALSAVAEPSIDVQEEVEINLQDVQEDNTTTDPVEFRKVYKKVEETDAFRKDEELKELSAMSGTVTTTPKSNERKERKVGVLGISPDDQNKLQIADEENKKVKRKTSWRSSLSFGKQKDVEEDPSLIAECSSVPANLDTLPKEESKKEPPCFHFPAKDKLKKEKKSKGNKNEHVPNLMKLAIVQRARWLRNSSESADETREKASKSVFYDTEVPTISNSTKKTGSLTVPGLLLKCRSSNDLHNNGKSDYINDSSLSRSRTNSLSSSSNSLPSLHDPAAKGENRNPSKPIPSPTAPLPFFASKELRTSQPDALSQCRDEIDAKRFGSFTKNERVLSTEGAIPSLDIDGGNELTTSNALPSISGHELTSLRSLPPIDNSCDDLISSTALPPFYESGSGSVSPRAFSTFEIEKNTYGASGALPSIDDLSTDITYSNVSQSTNIVDNFSFVENSQSTKGSCDDFTFSESFRSTNNNRTNEFGTSNTFLSSDNLGIDMSSFSALPIVSRSPRESQSFSFDTSPGCESLHSNNESTSELLSDALPSLCLQDMSFLGSSKEESPLNSTLRADSLRSSKSGSEFPGDGSTLKYRF